MTWLLAALLAGPLPGSGIWLDVPYASQLEDGCGSAVAWMVTEYWSGRNARPALGRSLEDIHQTLYSEELGGVPTTRLEAFFRALDFHAFGFAGTWADIEEHLARGRPLIAALEPAGLKAPLHYVAIVGIDPARDLVLLNDPATRKLAKMDRADFETQWEGTRNWMLLAVPR